MNKLLVPVGVAANFWGEMRKMGELNFRSHPMSTKDFCSTLLIDIDIQGTWWGVTQQSNIVLSAEQVHSLAKTRAETGAIGWQAQGGVPIARTHTSLEPTGRHLGK